MKIFVQEKHILSLQALHLKEKGKPKWKYFVKG